MERVLKSGTGWRIGWNPQSCQYQGLVGGDDWGIELTEAEFDDFCRLLGQLAEAIAQIASELMDEETITCEAESDLLWMEAKGYPNAYSIHCILNTGRRCEFTWPAGTTVGLVQAAQTIKVF